MTANDLKRLAEPIPATLLAELRIAAQASGRSLWELLGERLAASHTECLVRLGATLRLPTLDMESLYRLEPNFATLAYAEAVRRKCLVAGDREQTLVVLTDPFDLALQSWIEAKLGIAPDWRLAHPADLVAYFAVHEEQLRAMDGMLASIDNSEVLAVGTEDLSIASIAQNASPVIRLVNSTVFDAMKAGASDIHLETAANGLHVKYRIDGVLTAVAQVSGLEMAEQVVSRVKVMAELDIAERRIPQDGRFKISIKGREVDFLSAKGGDNRSLVRDDANFDAINGDFAAPPIGVGSEFGLFVGSPARQLERASADSGRFEITTLGGIRLDDSGIQAGHSGQQGDIGSREIEHDGVVIGCVNRSDAAEVGRRRRFGIFI